MERPAKRARIQEEIDVHEARRANDLRLKSRFEDIFEKYGRDFGTVGDEIDLRTGEIIVNNGHLQEMDNEQDVGRGLWDDFHPEDDSEEEEVPSTQLIPRNSHKKQKAGDSVIVEDPIPGPLDAEDPDIDPVWKTPDIESRFSTTLNITTPTLKQAINARPRSPPSSGSLWACSQKRRSQQRRKVKGQSQHKQGKGETRQSQELRESSDSDDPLNVELMSTAARTSSLLAKKRFGAFSLEENTRTTDPTDAHTAEHEESLTQSVERIHGKAKGTANQVNSSPVAGQQTREINGNFPKVLISIQVSKTPPCMETTQLNETPTENGPSATGFSSTLPSDHEENLPEPVDIYHGDAHEHIHQESHNSPRPAKEMIPGQSRLSSKASSKNRPQTLSPHEIKSLVGLRFLQKLPWRKILEVSNIARPSSRQLKLLYQVRNAVAGSGPWDSPPWSTEEQDRLKTFLSTRTTSWDEISLSIPGKSTAEIQCEWIRLCLENGCTTAATPQDYSQLGGSSDTSSTPSKYPNVNSPPQDPSTRRQQASLDSDNESNRSESPDPLSIAFERSWIGSGLSAMQIDTPPRPSRRKGNSMSPSKGSLTSSTKRSRLI